MMISNRLECWMLASIVAVCAPLGCGGKNSSKDAAGVGGAVGTGGGMSMGGSSAQDASSMGGLAIDAPGAGGFVGTGGIGTDGGGQGGLEAGGLGTGGKGNGGVGGSSVDADAVDSGNRGTGGKGTGGSGMGGQGTGGVGTGGTGTGGTTGPGGCQGNGGASMVQLPEGYCIDSTEVTRSQYAAWLSTNPATDRQVSDCTWNTTFTADSTCMASSYVCQSNCDNHPQVCVDWCDAYAFCKAKGKRLCGKTGGGTNATSNGADANQSQWYNACSSHGANTYPYGTTYTGQACNGWDRWETTFSQPPYDYITLPVGSQSTCQSSVVGYQGVFDLSGNASEWEDSCSNESGASARCLVRGGSLSSTSSNMRCDIIASYTRDLADLNVGFRCCSSP
jgi:formylglycine-generating enzyme required for sulfatase activity